MKSSESSEDGAVRPKVKERTREEGKAGKKLELHAMEEKEEKQGEKDSEEEDEEVGGEAGPRGCVKIQDPKLPTRAEVEEHNLTHLPFRNWCRHCIRGRGKEMPHRKATEDPIMQEFHCDWAFPGEEDGSGMLKVLVGRMRGVKMTLSTVHPSRTTGEFIAKRVMAFLRECGCELIDITIKTDQEPVMMSMVENLCRERARKGAMRTVVEHSPAYQSRSNGVVERAVQSVEAQMRVIRSSLEDRVEAKIGGNHAVWAWIAEYASYLLNRFEVGKDGKTAYERCKGKKAKVMGVEFGEGVLWKRRPIGGHLGKLSCLWEDGIYLGMKGTTGEVIVGDANGIHRTRTIQRKPEEKRWRKSNLGLVTGVPWKKSEDDPDVDGEGMECRELTEGERAELAKQIAWKETVPRSFSIRKQDIEDHGVTLKCPGCRAVISGKSRQEHSQACRKRFEAALSEDERVKISKAKMDEFISKIVENECSKEDKERKAGEEEEKAGGESEAKKARERRRSEEAEEESEANKAREGRRSEEAEEVSAAKKAGERRRGEEAAEESEAKKAREKRRSEEACEDSESKKARNEEEEEEREEKRRREENEEGSQTKRVKGEVARYKERQRSEEVSEESEAKRARSSTERSKREREEAEGGESDEEGKGAKKVMIGAAEVVTVDEEEQEEWAYDDVDGRPIDPGLVREARKEEVQFMKKTPVFEEVDVKECWERTGRPPISTKWVDHDKGRDGAKDVRSRWVARDFKTKGDKDREDLFAGMPPLEAKKALFKLAASRVKGRRTRTGEKMKLRFIDVRKAHLNGVCVMKMRTSSCRKNLERRREHVGS